MEELLTIDEAANYLGTKPELLTHFVKRGVAPALNLTSGWRFRKEELDNWIVGRGLWGKGEPRGFPETLETRFASWVEGEDWKGWAVPEGERADPKKLPNWARQGAFKYMRFDGGYLEEEKGHITGWSLTEEGFKMLSAVYTDRLDEAIEYLREGGINWVWITWSNGFSIEKESVQFEQCKRVIQKCHDADIRVSAYLSANNIFWEEMLESEPASKEWPHVEGGRHMLYAGREKRWLANLRQPGWLEYTKERMRRALEAGVDAFFFDNCESPTEDLNIFLPEIYRWLRQEQKSTAIIQWNIHVYDRPQNIPLEDVCDVIYNEWNLCVPGIDENNLPKVENIRSPNRYLLGHLPQGKSMFTEVPRYADTGFSPRTQHLFSYEAAAFGGSAARYLTGYTNAGLLDGVPEVVSLVRAFGDSNRFLNTHSDLYRDTESTASIAILVYGPSWEADVLDALTRLNILYDIIEVRALARVHLSRYKLIVSAGASAPDWDMMEVLPTYRGEGGKVAVCSGGADFRDLADFTWSDRVWEVAGRDTEVAKKLADEISGVADSPLVRVGSPHVIANLRKKVDGSSWFLHLLNYGDEPIGKLDVSLILPVRADGLGEVISPDKTQHELKDVAIDEGGIRFQLSELDEYAVVTIKGRET